MLLKNLAIILIILSFSFPVFAHDGPSEEQFDRVLSQLEKTTDQLSITTEQLKSSNETIEFLREELADANEEARLLRRKLESELVNQDKKPFTIGVGYYFPEGFEITTAYDLPFFNLPIGIYSQFGYEFNSDKTFMSFGGTFSF